VARASGTAADPFCAADRRYGAHPVVVHLGGPAPSAQANSAFDPVKRTQSSLACENVRAVDALDTAREMSPGDERTEAMKTAKILGNAYTSISSARSASRQNDGSAPISFD
jgi:hypothetical protein